MSRLGSSETESSGTKELPMTIQWLGHAGFRITHQGYSIVIDPYNSETAIISTAIRSCVSKQTGSWSVMNTSDITTGRA